jgi:hypothetical protein
MNTALCQGGAMATHIDLKATHQIVRLRFGDVVVIANDDGQNLL